MNSKQAHEPEAPVMDANDVWEDAKRLAQARRQVNNVASAVIRMQVPLSAFLAALDEFDHDELILVRQRVEEMLAA
ncbi:MAG: hypothetical protein IAE81_18680 [Caldilineaceae bacterium]|jgi:hypothetical protein|nr:hypothetical protein [Caldilineaceae bacterium]